MDVKLPVLPSTQTCTVAKILVSPGDFVIADQELFSIETGKQAVALRAETDGIVARVLVEEGSPCYPGDILAELEPQPASHNGAEKADAFSTPPTALPSKAAIPTLVQPASSASAPSETGETDLLIIGGGTGGYVAALYAAKLGKQVTLVEKDQLGGTCLNRGCIPTKSLVASARVHRTIARAGQWGIDVDGTATPNMEKIIARKDAVVGGLRDGLSFLMEKNGIDVIRGSAQFEDVRNVRVSGASGEVLRLTFRDCIIATGSAIRELKLPGADLPEVMNTDEALDSRVLPASITIVGGGVTGMEFAFLYSNLGVETTVLARRPRLLHTFGQSASDAMTASAREHGMRIELGADVRAFAKDGEAITTTFEQNGQVHSARSERVLVAGGRVPQTDGLKLERAGVAIDPATQAVQVDAHMRTSAEHIYAVGDVNGLVMLAHAASYQGRVVVDNILGNPTAFDEALVPFVAYTDPEVAMVGAPDTAQGGPSQDRTAEAQHRPIIGTFAFAHNGKALADNAPEGGVELSADEAGRIRGAQVIGAHASDLIGYAALAVAAGLSATDLQRTVFPHPTSSEAIGEATFDLTFGALHK